MIVRTKLALGAQLRVTLPSTGLFGLVKVDAILAHAARVITPFVQDTLKSSLAKLAVLGITVEVVGTQLELTEDP